MMAHYILQKQYRTTVKFKKGLCLDRLLNSACSYIIQSLSDSGCEDDHEGSVFLRSKHSKFPHHSLEHGSVCGACRVRCVGHALSQVTGAVQRVCSGPFFKRLLSIKKHKLQRHWKFLGGKKKKESQIEAGLSLCSVVTVCIFLTA